MDIKLAKTNIRKQVGGSLLTSILTMSRALAPTIGKTIGLATLGRLASKGPSKLVKKMTGGNLLRDVVDKEIALASTLKKMNGGQVGGFLIPQNRINQLIAYKHLLTNNQKTDILNALQTGSDVRIQLTTTQLGNGLGTVLATIGIPLAVEMVNNWEGHPSYWKLPKTRWPWSPSIGCVPTTSPFYWNMETDAWRWSKKKKNSEGQRTSPGAQFTVQNSIHNSPIHRLR